MPKWFDVGCEKNGLGAADGSPKPAAIVGTVLLKGLTFILPAAAVVENGFGACGGPKPVLGTPAGPKGCGEGLVPPPNEDCMAGVPKGLGLPSIGDGTPKVDTPLLLLNGLVVVVVFDAPRKGLLDTAWGTSLGNILVALAEYGV